MNAIFLLSEAKCQIFPDIVSGGDIFILWHRNSQLRNFLALKFFKFNFFWGPTFNNDLWSSMIDQRSSIMHRDYYWLIMDYQHDSGLKLFLDIEISQLRNFLTLKFFNFNFFWGPTFINDLWSSMIDEWSSMMRRDYYWSIMGYQHDSGIFPA